MSKTTAKNVEDWNYKNFERFVKRSQIILAILLGVFIFIIPEIRQQIQSKPAHYIVGHMSFEIVMFAIVLYIFGLKRIPVNYISLIFLRFYIFFDGEYWNRLDKGGHKMETQPWYTKWFISYWHKVFGYRKQVTMSKPVDCFHDIINLYIEHLIFGFLLLSFTGVVTIFSKIDISRCEWLALSFISVGTCMSTIILISSMALDRLGRTYHSNLCIIWTFISLVAALFTFVFATQRLYKRLHGKISSSQNFYRTQAELLIFAINICVVVYYIPIIHPGFSFYNTISDFPTNVGNIVPEPVVQFTHSVIEETKVVASSTWWPHHDRATFV